MSETTPILDVVPKVSFSWYDYVLFSAMLVISALIGIYFGCFGSKQATADEYLMGNKKMKVVPISISLVASHISGITLLAVPAEVYRYGANYWLIVVAITIAAFATIFIYLPVFFKLGIRSTYEYLERRFNSANRTLASFLFTLGIFLYLPLVIYIPALAFSAATGINVHYITPLVCGVCIFYTTLGGLKAVVWTDTLQFTVTTGAVCTVFVIGVKAGGGFDAIWAKASDGDRLNFFNFDPDPTLRDSFWISTIGLSFYWIAIIATHQSCVQKFLSVATLREAKLSVLYFALGFDGISSISVFTGLIMYARYSKCDPFTTGAVQKNDQLLPYYIMDVASHVPGLSGLFIAGIFCAALSTLSASLNCMAGSVFEDFVLKLTGPIENERRVAFILKLIVVVSGVLCTLLVIVFERLGGLLALCISLGSVALGPLLGMFTVGLLFPKVSSKGCFYGTVFSLLFTGWIVVMAQTYKSQGVIGDVPKPTSIDGCRVLSTEFTNVTENISTLPNFTSTEMSMANNFYNEEVSKPLFLFRISYYYCSAIGTILTIISALIISVATKSDDLPVHKDLISPVVHFLLPRSTTENPEYHTVGKALELVTVNLGKEESKN